MCMSMKGGYVRNYNDGLLPDIQVLPTELLEANRRLPTPIARLASPCASCVANPAIAAANTDINGHRR